MATELHCQDLGSGPPVVLVHGFPLQGSMWDGAGALLAGHFRVLIPDQRGFGRTPASPGATMASYADDLARLLDRHAIERPALLAGLSFGGYVVLEFMRRHADRIDAVGLIDTREVGDSPEAAAGRRASADALDAGGPVSALSDVMLPKLFGPGAPGELVEHWRRVMAGQSPVGVAAALRALAGRADSTETLRAFPGRALVVVGEHDAITPVGDHERMAGLMPRSELHIMPGCGHMAPAERPEAFVGIVRAFLGGTGGIC